MFTEDRGFLILGTRRSGIAAAKLLKEHGGRVFFYDDDIAANDRNYLLALGAVETNAEGIWNLAGEISCVILSPAVPLFHPLVQKLMRTDIEIIGELELAARFTAGKILAVTGTNGKSTTTSLLYHILKEARLDAYLGGNIGVPLSSVCERATSSSYLAVEVSSYQLETVSHFCPSAAALLNLAPDHLARHGTMENYFAAKKRIFENMRAGDIAVLGADDRRICELARDIDCDTHFFSAMGEVRGAYISGGEVVFSAAKKMNIMSVEEIPLIGAHNVMNVLAAVAMLGAVGIDADVIRRGVMNFKGLKHRLQVVRSVCGKTFINDSKATNVDSALSAVRAVQGETVLILGGSSKGEDYRPLFDALDDRKVVHCVLTGATRYELLNAAVAAGYNNLTLSQDFNAAVKRAALVCPVGGSVLLSPACASFDCFKDFEDRGEKFISVVNSL